MKAIDKALQVAEKYQGQIWDAEVCQYMITEFLDGILEDPEALGRVIYRMTTNPVHMIVISTIEALKQEVQR